MIKEDMKGKTLYVNYLIPIVILFVILLIVMIARTALENSYELLPADFSQEPQPEELQNWKQVESKENGFQALFPTAPQHATKSVIIPDSDKKSVYDMYVSELKNGSIFMLRIVTYSKDYTFPSQNKALKSPMEEMMSANDKNVLRKVENQTFQGFPAVNFAIQNPKEKMEGISFLVANKLYLLSYIAKLANYRAGEFTQFANSFKLSDNPEAEPIDARQEAEKLMNE